MNELRVGGLYKLAKKVNEVGEYFDPSTTNISVVMNYWPHDGQQRSEVRRLKYGEPFLLLKSDLWMDSFKILIDDFVGWINIIEGVEELVEVSL